jgi:tRNA pseudouridine38-40 synthase
MQRFRLTIAYDGTTYAGWQQQPNLRTIEGTIHSIFFTVFGSQMIFLGASRTDAGVHALGQVAMLDTELQIGAQKLQWVLNNSLPNDIMITKCVAVPADFHTHYNVVDKTYHYHFFTERPLPFVHRYGWHYYKKIDFEKLKKALNCFVGTHDFRAFSTDEPADRDTVRSIHEIFVDQSAEFRAHRIVVRGNKFLHHMIRRMVGTALEVASRESFSVDLIKEKLASKNPAGGMLNAPAHGLLLYNVRYEGD